jgi:phenylalanyl-tRNA synthetase beta subunit
MERTLTQAEVGKVHERIKAQLAADLGVTLR